MEAHMGSKTKHSKAKAAVGIIVFLLLLFGGAYVLFASIHDDRQEMIDRGCIPSGASDLYGNPTTWSCPIP